jgi:hypothetical protein
VYYELITQDEAHRFRDRVCRLTITQDDILCGRRNNTQDCAVARAAIRAGLHPVCVEPARSQLGPFTTHHSPAVNDWIRDMDDGRIKAPTVFYVIARQN